MEKAYENSQDKEFMKGLQEKSTKGLEEKRKYSDLTKNKPISLQKMENMNETDLEIIQEGCVAVLKENEATRKIVASSRKRVASYTYGIYLRLLIRNKQVANIGALIKKLNDEMKEGETSPLLWGETTLYSNIRFSNIIDKNKAPLFLTTCECTWSDINKNMTAFEKEMGDFLKINPDVFN